MQVISNDFTIDKNGKTKINNLTNQPFQDSDIFVIDKKIKNENGIWVRKITKGIFYITPIILIKKFLKMFIQDYIVLNQKTSDKKQEVIRFMEKLQMTNSRGEKMSFNEILTEFPEIGSIVNVTANVKQEYSEKHIQEVLRYWIHNSKPSDIVETLSPCLNEYGYGIYNVELQKVVKKSYFY